MTVGLVARGSDKVMAVTVAAAMENKGWRWAAGAAQDLTQRADVLHSPVSYSTTPKKSRLSCGVRLRGSWRALEVVGRGRG